MSKTTTTTCDVCGARVPEGSPVIGGDIPAIRLFFRDQDNGLVAGIQADVCSPQCATRWIVEHWPYVGVT